MLPCEIPVESRRVKPPSAPREIYRCGQDRLSGVRRAGHRHGRVFFGDRYHRAGRSRASAVGANRWGNDAGRRHRESRNLAARGARDRCFPSRLGHHQPRFVPIECGGEAGDTPLDAAAA